jgi:hypothetical protein
VPTLAEEACLTLIVRVRSAWMKKSSLSFLSSKRISLQLAAPPSLELRVRMPLCVGVLKGMAFLPL